MSRATIIGFRATALVPLAWTLLFASFVVRAWIKLGQLPVPYRPDPKELGFEWHVLAIHGLFFVCMASLVSFPWSIYDLKRMHLEIRPIYLSAFFCGWLIMGVIFFIDPGSFWSWFMD